MEKTQCGSAPLYHNDTLACCAEFLCVADHASMLLAWGRWMRPDKARMMKREFDRLYTECTERGTIAIMPLPLYKYEFTVDSAAAQGWTGAMVQAHRADDARVALDTYHERGPANERAALLTSIRTSLYSLYVTPSSAVDYTRTEFLFCKEDILALANKPRAPNDYHRDMVPAETRVWTFLTYSYNFLQLSACISICSFIHCPASRTKIIVAMCDTAGRDENTVRAYMGSMMRDPFLALCPHVLVVDSGSYPYNFAARIKDVARNRVPTLEIATGGGFSPISRTKNRAHVAVHRPSRQQPLFRGKHVWCWIRAKCHEQPRDSNARMSPKPTTKYCARSSHLRP